VKLIIKEFYKEQNWISGGWTEFRKIITDDKYYRCFLGSLPYKVDYEAYCLNQKNRRPFFVLGIDQRTKKIDNSIRLFGENQKHQMPVIWKDHNFLIFFHGIPEK